MSKATLVRLQWLEVKAWLDGSIENLTDAQVFSACRTASEFMPWCPEPITLTKKKRPVEGAL